MNPMKPQDALQFLDDVVSKSVLTRQGHQMAQMAISALHEAITPKPPKEEKPKEPKK